MSPASIALICVSVSLVMSPLDRPPGIHWSCHIRISLLIHEMPTCILVCFKFHLILPVNYYNPTALIPKFGWYFFRCINWQYSINHFNIWIYQWDYLHNQLFTKSQEKAEKLNSDLWQFQWRSLLTRPKLPRLTRRKFWQGKQIPPGVHCCMSSSLRWTPLQPYKYIKIWSVRQVFKNSIVETSQDLF